MKQISIGSQVRIADGAMLDGALRLPAGRRPEPEQMLWAGRLASVTSFYRRGAANLPVYALKDAPGLWPEEWIDPI